MHVVFIVGNYYPNFSAVGKCVGNVADELSQTHKVTVLCLKSHPDQRDDEVYNNQKILRVVTKESEKRLTIEHRIRNSTKIIKGIYQLIYNLYKMNRIVITVLSRTSTKKELIESYLRGLISINESIDAIIPSSMPFESVVAACEYKAKYDNQIKVIPYLFDQFVENANLHRFNFNRRLKRKTHIKLERSVIKKSDHILILKQLNDYFLEQHKGYMKKFYVIEHPLLKNPNVTLDSYNGQMRFIYAGSFYKTIRNPKYMLNLFNDVLENLDGELTLYSFGNCKKIINKYTSKNKRIIDKGKVPTDEVYEELPKNNFLVAVGNKDNKQVPSKIFEYLSYGKPIIYFYSNNQDTNLAVLKKYRLSICIDQSNTCPNSNFNELVKFCKDNINKQLSFGEISAIFKDATPECTKDIIKRLIES